MEKKLEQAETKAGWTMTFHNLDTASLTVGVPFAGMRIRTLEYGFSRSGIAISQQRQLERLDKIVADERPTDTSNNVVWCPVPPNWNAVASAEQPKRADQEAYAKLMGSLMWMTQIAMHRPHRY